MATSAPTPATSPPTPDLFTIVARSLVACVLAEVVVVSALTSHWTLTWQAWAFAIGWGLGAGAALAVAEATLWRFGVVAALVVGACLGPLAPLGGDFELAFVDTWSVDEATTAALACLEESSPAEWGAFAGGAVFVFGPLLVALRRRATPRGQALAMIVGALLWALIVWVVAPWRVDPTLTWRITPLLLLGPALVLPPARCLGDRLALAARRGSSRQGRRHDVVRRGARSAQLAGLALVTLTISIALRRAPDESLEVARTRWRAVVESDTATLLEIGDELRWFDFGAPLASPRPRPLPPSASFVLSACRPALQVSILSGVDRRWESESYRAALGWYARAASLGDSRAIARIRSLSFLGLDPEVLGWLRQDATGGDADAALDLGLRLVHDDAFGPDWAPYRPEHPEPEYDEQWDRSGPSPGTRDRAVVEGAREGLRWLRHATDLGGARARLHLQRALRAAPSATTVEALARLAEAEWRVPTLPTWWRVRERRAIARARAALAVGSGPTRGGDRP